MEDLRGFEPSIDQMVGSTKFTEARSGRRRILNSGASFATLAPEG
jgi:hypothetical protein